LAPTQTIHDKRSVGKSRKRWEDGDIEDVVTLLGTLLRQLQPKIRETRRQRTCEARYGW